MPIFSLVDLIAADRFVFPQIKCHGVKYIQGKPQQPILDYLSLWSTTEGMNTSLPNYVLSFGVLVRRQLINQRVF